MNFLKKIKFKKYIVTKQNISVLIRRLKFQGLILYDKIDIYVNTYRLSHASKAM